MIAGDYGEKFESYPVDAGYKHASPEALDAWRDRKYGMRIVWGVYSRLNVEASWPLTGFRTSDDLPQFRQSTSSCTRSSILPISAARAGPN